MGAEGAPSVIRRGIRANMEVIPVPLHYTPFMCIFHVTQEGSMQTTAEKQRTNITLTAENLAAARELGYEYPVAPTPRGAPALVCLDCRCTLTPSPARATTTPGTQRR